MNKLLAMRTVYHKEEDNITSSEYFSTSLFTHLMSLPSEKLTTGLYNVACDMWVSLAYNTGDIDTIVNVTATCLNRKTFLFIDRRLRLW